MEFGEYIGTLCDTDSFETSKARLGVDLFKAAGSYTEIKEDTVKKWISGARNCSIRTYFPESEIDEEQFIAYFRRRTRAPGSWEEIQKAFSSKISAGVDSKGICVDLTTADPEVFYWSLLNQFQRIFHLPESEREANDLASPVSAPPQKQITSEQVQKLFLEEVQQYKVMDIINRKPAIFNRYDTADLSVFLDRIDILLPHNNPYDASLNASIRSFVEDLRLKVITIDANLNRRFPSDDETASINMENHEEDCGNYPNPCGIPEFTPELFNSACDPVALLGIVVREWGNFRDKMNRLFEDISSWQNKPSA